MLMNSVSYYVSLKQNGDGINESIKKRFAKVVNATGYKNLQRQLSNDNVSISKFPAWWGRYFQAVSKTNYDSVSVVKSYVYSKTPYHKAETDSIIFTLKLQ